MGESPRYGVKVKNKKMMNCFKTSLLALLVTTLPFRAGKAARVNSSKCKDISTLDPFTLMKAATIRTTWTVSSELSTLLMKKLPSGHGNGLSKNLQIREMRITYS